MLFAEPRSLAIFIVRPTAPRFPEGASLPPALAFSWQCGRWQQVCLRRPALPCQSRCGRAPGRPLRAILGNNNHHARTRRLRRPHSSAPSRGRGRGEGSNAYCPFLCRQLGSPPRATLSMEVTLRRQAGPWRKGASRRKTRSPARASARLCARHGEADEPESQHAAGQTGPGGRGRGRQLVQAAGASRCPPRPAGTRPVLPLLARTAWGDRARGSGKRGQGPPSPAVARRPPRPHVGAIGRDSSLAPPTAWARCGQWPDAGQP